MQMQILERADTQSLNNIRHATTFKSLSAAFLEVFGLSGAETKTVSPSAYKEGEYGLKVRGIKKREQLNAAVREILEKVDDPADLTQDQRDLLLQYSGRGGLTENSQYEYYTPSFVAEGAWGAMRANGFTNGNVLDPCTGAGVFSGTKPKGVVVSGNDLDPTGSKVTALLNPGDHITNEPFEQVVMGTADNTYDSVISNVPFGAARGKNAHLDPAYKSERKIERYFLLRAMDKIKPGGLACFVVPINIVGATGKAWEKFRLAMSKKGEFLGAHKLPSKTFAAQGTDTVVDVVVFKKHSKDLLEKIDALDSQVLWDTSVFFDEFVKGKYWQGEGKKFIMGKYIPKVAGERWSREAVDGDIDSESIKAKLAHKFTSRIDWDALDATEPREIAYSDGDRRVMSGTMYEMQAGQWTRVEQTIDKTEVSKTKYGADSTEEMESLLKDHEGALSLSFKQLENVAHDFPQFLTGLQKQAVDFASQQAEEYREQIMRGTVLGGLISRMKAAWEKGEDVTADREALQLKITSEVERYGLTANNKKLVLAGEGSRAFGMFKNAIDQKGDFSALLKGTLERADEEHKYNPEDPEAIVSHWSVREGISDIELDDVKKLYTGTHKLDSLGDLAEFPGVAITPDGHVMPMNRYCSGEIFPKIADLTEAISNTKDSRLKARFQEQIDTMLRKMKHTKTEDIAFGLQQKWLSPQIVVEFLKANGYPNVKYGLTHEVEEEDYMGDMVKREKFDDTYAGPEGEFTGIGDYGGFYKQFQKYLNGGKVTSSKANILEDYRAQVSSLEEQFNSWMQQRPDIEDVSADYNRRFNGNIPLEYEGDSLGIDEYLSGEIIPHGYQNAEARRLSEEGRGVCGFGVGLGKTFETFAFAALDLKKGRSKRKCIIVPNSVLENWYHEARTFLAEGFMRKDVLFVGLEPKFNKKGEYMRKPVLDENGKPKETKGKPVLQDDVVFQNSKQAIFESMWKIPQSNYKLVVMTKEKFGSIPLRPDTVDNYASEMMKNDRMSESEAENLKKKAGKKSYADAVKGAADEQKYSDTGTAKKGELPYLEDMGFDSIVVDEVHNYKNSMSPGKDTQRVAYLPTAPTAQVAQDMAIKAHYLRQQNNGRGIVGLSATPVTNSPFEIFNQLSLVCDPEEFHRFGVYNVDDFVRVFGHIETVDKVKVNGEVSQMPGLVGFQNLDGLRNLFDKYVNIKTVKDVDHEVHVPDGIENQDEVEMSDDQKTAYDALRERAKKAVNPNTPIEEREHIFAVIRDMDRATTDMDLYRRTMTFVFPKAYRDKVGALEKELPKEYSVTLRDEDGSTYSETREFESVFIDNGDFFNFVVPDSYEDLVTARFPGLGISMDKVSHPVTPKYAKMIENLRTHYEMKGKQIIFTEEKTQHQKIKRLLVNSLGIPEKEIGVINAETANGKKLDAISKAFNAGSLKIVIANKKAEVGVNLQKGTSAIHHLTLPWTPASIEQRNGRGVRQGNTRKTVDLYYYFGKGSFDAYRKDLLQSKANWINDLFTGDAVAALNGDATSNEEFLDLLSDNPEEAKQRREARKEAAKKKREDRHAKNLINKFQVLASNSKSLAEIDISREDDRKAKTEKLEKANGKLHLNEERLKHETDPDEQVKIKKRITAAKAEVKKFELQVGNVDKAWDAQKAKIEASIKQATGFLRQQAKEGKLPFDEALIDNPANAVATITGEIVSKGGCYEIKDKDGEFVSLFKITDVEIEGRRVQVETIVSRNSYSLRNGWHSLNEITSSFAISKVSYSEKELALKKIEASGSIQYKDIIPKLGIDAQTFAENHDMLFKKCSGTAVYEIDGNIAIQAYYDDPTATVRLVYPDVSSDSFKKKVLTAYLIIKRAQTRSYDASCLMDDLFGSGLASLIAEYGTRATPEQINEVIAKVWADYQAESMSNGTSLEEQLRSVSYGESRSLMLKSASPLGDNEKEIKEVVTDFIKGLDSKLRQQITEARAEEQRLLQLQKDKELEDLKKSGVYKEVPLDVEEKFRVAGVVAKVNLRPADLSFKGRVTTHEAFSRWWFQDIENFGILYRMKNKLKMQHSAKFTKEWREHSGAWWHVASTEDLNEILNLFTD